ncbi:MAG: NapC/NirT family cytochrome c [Nitrospiria bacterium]
MKRFFFGSFVFTGLIATVVTGGRVLENHPSFCNSCHEMNRPHDGWISSGAEKSHPNCMDCHSGAGVTGVIEAELRGLGQLIEHFTLSERELKGPFIARAPKEFCLKCHHVQMPRTVKAHRPFKIEGKECSRCHRHQAGWEFAGEIRKE